MPILGIMASAISGNLGLSVDYLVVAGGGGGGNSYGGGGGGGGLRSTVTSTGGGGTLESPLTLAFNTSFTVTIGAGGAGGVNNGAASQGANSVFSTITSTGGGGGANQAGTQFAPTTGGSGGGGGYNPNENGANGTANQGFRGGNMTGGLSVAVGAGGGGAGAQGVDGGTAGNATNGGNGVATSISGSSVTYAGGGGGGSTIGGGNGISAGSGGSGGGGAGSFVAGGNGTNGTANTGGGGGGSGYYTGTPTNAPSGGSGIVIARYAGTTQKAYGGTVTTSGGNTIHTFTSSGKFYTVFEPPVSGYSLWLDAADASTFTFSSGTVVSQWNDKSGSSRNFTQATVANQPTRNVTQNGLPGLTFNADFMANTGFNWVNSAFTVFVVMKYVYPVFNFTGILGANISSGPTMGMDSTDAFATFKVGVSSSPYNLFPTSSNADVAVWKAPGVSSGSLTTTFYRNGTQASATTTMTGLSTGTGAVLGASTTAPADLSPANNFTSIYEVLVYPSQLSDTDRNSVEAYLKTKWGTP